MGNLINFIKKQCAEHRAFLLYGLISVFVTVLDIIACRISELFFNPVTSNTIGVVLGFIVQYFLTSRHVYNSENLRTFLIFLATFGFGLLLANSIVFLSRMYLFDNSNSAVAFLVSKFLSIVLPFFVTYYLRKILIKSNEDEKK